MMIVQSAPVVLKQRNQPNRECLYAWYPEAVVDGTTTRTLAPRDIYIHKGIDKDLLQQSQSTNTSYVDGSNNNNNSYKDVLQRYKQSVGSSERIYHSVETLEDALQTPWALHYEIQRRVATPNLPSHSTDIPKQDEMPRRLKSAPLVRTHPVTSVLTIPEPRFINPIIPVSTTQLTQSPPSGRPKTRASSAKARLNTTFPICNEQVTDNVKQSRREIKSASRIRTPVQTDALNETQQATSAHNDSNIVQQQEELPPPPLPTLSPNLFRKSNSWCGNEIPSPVLERKSARIAIEKHSVPLNPYYVHRPGVVSVQNMDKKPVVEENISTKKQDKSSRRQHQRRHHRHHRHHQQQQHESRNEPLLALTPISQIIKSPVEMDGIKLTYDPTITLNDPSSSIIKYFVEGRLYLIKDQRYNVIENIDPEQIEKYNQNSTLPQRPKYYQTIPVDKFQIQKPPQELHYNASETYFYNTIPKRVHRFVIDPNFISENLNVNKMSLSKRPSTASATRSAVSDMNRQQPTATVYA